MEELRLGEVEFARVAQHLFCWEVPVGAVPRRHLYKRHEDVSAGPEAERRAELDVGAHVSAVVAPDAREVNGRADAVQLRHELVGHDHGVRCL